jgi:hypothetical protein
MEYLPEDAQGNKAECAETDSGHEIWVAGISVHITETHDEAMAIVAMLDKYPYTRTMLVEEIYAKQTGGQIKIVYP